EKPSWADLVDEAGETGLTGQIPPSSEIITTYRVETRRVAKEIAKRKLWKKFGDSKNDKPGPNKTTTNVCDDVFLILTSNKENPDATEEDPLKKLSGQKIVQCRICKGDHWTTKCPYKDQLEVIHQQLKEDDGTGQRILTLLVYSCVEHTRLSLSASCWLGKSILLTKI
ncbi:predicted protein, partial [Nematostella vectensis]